MLAARVAAVDAVGELLPFLCGCVKKGCATARRVVCAEGELASQAYKVFRELYLLHGCVACASQVT